MTRFARMQKRKHLEASPWEELAGACTGKERVKEDKERTPDQVHVKKGNKIKASKEINTLKTRETNNDCVESCAPKKPKISDTHSLETGHVISHKNSKEELTKLKGNTEKCEENFPGRKRSKHKSNEKGRRREMVGLSRKSSSSPALQTSFSQTGNQRNHEKLEKRREARRKRREKKKVCLHCRQPGHKVSECPQSEVDQSGVGSCYKCGSLDHMTKNCREKIGGGDNPFPFAKCFVCGEKGHLARECPENPRGLYPRGGGCKICGSVEHLKRDCPEKLQNKMKGIIGEENYAASSFGRRGHMSADAELEQVTAKSEISTTKKKGVKIVQF